LTQLIAFKGATIKAWVAAGETMLQEDTLILEKPRAVKRFANGVPKRLGNFLIEYLLGQGGMATVYKGSYHGPHGFSQAVAIKVAKPHPADMALLHREARLLAQIQHPNIIHIIDSGESNGHAYYAMDWVDGWTLKQLLQRNSSLPPLVCIEIIQQLCHALSCLHNRSALGISFSIVHGDIKPANIMVNENGWVRLLDFGIASVRDATLKTASYGSAAYISPEQLNSPEPDARSDIFSLGAVMYEMATGERLFPEEDITSLVRKRVDLENHINRATMTSKITKCHPELVSIIHRCTQEKQQKRFHSAAQLADALEHAKNKIVMGPGLKKWLHFM